jgi:hypothetical protein
MGLRKTGFEDRQAAMVKIGSRHWKTVARMSIWEALASNLVSRMILTHFPQAKVEREQSLENP